jgi:hypothetical protein
VRYFTVRVSGQRCWGKAPCGLLGAFVRGEVALLYWVRGGCGEGVEMLSDPFKGTDLSALSVVERAQVDKLRRVCRDEGKEGLVRALVDLAKTNSALFMRLLREIIH